MKKFFCFFSALTIALPGIQSVSYANEIENEYVYYVDINGSDSAEGSINNPFKTVERARTQIRELRENGIDDHASILIREGEYYRITTLALTEKDYNMTISAYGDEKVIFTGGKKIKNENITSAQETEIGSLVLDDTAKNSLKMADINNYYYYATELPLHNSYYDVVRLYGNGKPYVMSSYPEDKADALKMIAVDEGNPNKFSYQDDSNRQELWSDKSIEDMYIYGKLSACWYIEFDKASEFSKEDKTITIEKPRSEFKKDESDFLIRNIPEEINSPGECYFDLNNKKVYYYPLSDNNELTVALNKKPLISAVGSRDINIENINFEYVRNSLFNVDNCTRFVFDNCDFKHFMVVNTFSGNQNKMTNCEFYDGARGGVSFTGGDTVNLTGGGNVIENCTFDSVSNVRPSYAPAVAMGGYNNTLRNSELKNSEHQLMQVGGVDSLIEGNEIHHGAQWVVDNAAVYYGRTPTSIGIEFRNNIFHDNYSEYGDYGSSSLYWDDRALGPWIHDNIFYETDPEMAKQCNASALKSNAGVYSTVENNTFVNVSPIHNIDYNFDTDQHLVFWLLCNGIPTLVSSETSDYDSFTGWWTRITESGYFGAWQDHFKDSVWKDYMTMLSGESHQEIQDLIDNNGTRADFLEVAKKYAPHYGVNKFRGNVIYGIDKETDVLFGNSMQFNEEKNNYFTDRTDIFKDFDNKDYELTDKYKMLRDNELLCDDYVNVSCKDNIVYIKGFIDDTEEKLITVKSCSNDDVIFYDQKFALPQSIYEFKCATDTAENIKVELNISGKKIIKNLK